MRTQIYLRRAVDWEAVSRAHGRVFAEIRPANTLLAAGGLVGDYEVEIEAEAVVGAERDRGGVAQEPAVRGPE